MSRHLHYAHILNRILYMHDIEEHIEPQEFEISLDTKIGFAIGAACLLAQDINIQPENTLDSYENKLSLMFNYMHELLARMQLLGQNKFNSEVIDIIQKLHQLPHDDKREFFEAIENIYTGSEKKLYACMKAIGTDFSEDNFEEQCDNNHFIDKYAELLIASSSCLEALEKILKKIGRSYKYIDKCNDHIALPQDDYFIEFKQIIVPILQVQYFGILLFTPFYPRSAQLPDFIKANAGGFYARYGLAHAWGMLLAVDKKLKQMSRFNTYRAAKPFISELLLSMGDDSFVNEFEKHFNRSVYKPDEQKIRNIQKLVDMLRKIDEIKNSDHNGNCIQIPSNMHEAIKNAQRLKELGLMALYAYYGLLRKQPKILAIKILPVDEVFVQRMLLPIANVAECGINMLTQNIPFYMYKMDVGVINITLNFAEIDPKRETSINAFLKMLAILDCEEKFVKLDIRNIDFDPNHYRLLARIFDAMQHARLHQFCVSFTRAPQNLSETYRVCQIHNLTHMFVASRGKGFFIGKVPIPTLYEGVPEVKTLLWQSAIQDKSLKEAYVLTTPSTNKRLHDEEAQYPGYNRKRVKY